MMNKGLENILDELDLADDSITARVEDSFKQANYMRDNGNIEQLNTTQHRTHVMNTRLGNTNSYLLRLLRLTI